MREFQGVAQKACQCDLLELCVLGLLGGLLGSWEVQVFGQERMSGVWERTTGSNVITPASKTGRCQIKRNDVSLSRVSGAVLQVGGCARDTTVSLFGRSVDVGGKDWEDLKGFDFR